MPLLLLNGHDHVKINKLTPFFLFFFNTVKSPAPTLQLLSARSCCRKSRHACAGMGQRVLGWEDPTLEGTELHPAAPKATAATSAGFLRPPALGAHLLAHSLLTCSTGRRSWSSLAGSVEQFWARETRSVRWNFRSAAQTCFMHRF